MNTDGKSDHNDYGEHSKRRWWAVSVEETGSLLETNIESGLNSKEVSRRLERYGANELAEKKQISMAQKIIAQFKDVMVLILIAASVLSAFLGDYIEAAVILAIVVINAVLGLVQEGRAEKALEALKKMSSPQAKVKRDGAINQVDSSQIVLGDIVVIEAGDLVPADIRLVESQSLKAEEASLTGESLAVEKQAAELLQEDAGIGDRSNMLFMGTAITYGRGVGIVCATGSATEIGKISDKLQEIEDDPTPLQVSLNQLGKWLGIICVVVCVVILAQGILLGGDAAEMIMTAISLAVAAIPEGLPAVVTIVLALGMKRMAERNAIVKRLLAVETLGCVDIICTDKTGTLTQNEMTVTELYIYGNTYEVSGSGYSSEGEIVESDADGINETGASNRAQEISEVEDSDLSTMLKIALLCNEAVITEEESGDNKVIGDPTEGALLVVAAKSGLDRKKVQKKYPRVADWPFDSERKMMTSFNERFIDGKIHALTKGAPDIIIDKCSRILIDGSVQELDAEAKEEILRANADMAGRALRVLAFSYAFFDRDQELQGENDMIFVGLSGMIDPGRPEARDAVSLCRQAGIKPVMITGDYPDTAAAIAADLGLVHSGDGVMTGAEVEKMTEHELKLAVEHTSVYARVSPEHKVKIVTALRNNGHIASMTGDGVNDAMALKSADIGVAMGITGTEVAKSTADMILTDDNFATIVDAVREGRIIYSNIRKFVGFLLSCNVGEILIIALTSLILGPKNIPLLPIQLLWLNLITDSFPALALGQEKGEPDIMKQNPRSPKEPILNRDMIFVIATQSIAIFISVFVSFIIGKNNADTAENVLTMGRTYAFTTLILAELFRSFSARSEKISVFRLGLLTNKTLVKAFVFSVFMLIAVVYVPILQPLFSTLALGIMDWLIILPLSLIPFSTAELFKLLRKSRD
ncbi:MAG: cation-translocating P-type ATPase [Eubacteriales bacterium]|nr:cation-translocating P-type ATPase [Eubacteriales bacterium]